MHPLVHKRSHLLGLPPGTLVPREDTPSAPIQITLYQYAPDTLTEQSFARIEDLPGERIPGARHWLDIDGVHDLSLLQSLQTFYQLHPLVIEDICNIGQRAKVEDYGGYLYVVLKMITISNRRPHFEQVSLVLGPDYVLSFQEAPGDVFDPVRKRLRNPQGLMRNHGSCFLAYALLDVIVDHYFLVLETLGERLEQLEEKVLRDPSTHTQKQIRDMRRDLIQLRRSVWPVRDLINGLERTESDLMPPAVRPYLRDLYDHVIQIIDIIESLRDVLAGLTDLYLSSLSHRMNEVMKVLTIIGTIFIPLTFIAGVYGMNFDVMPELHYRYGYPLVMGIMMLIGLMLVYYFKRKEWL